jgi:hypothetical protein
MPAGHRSREVVCALLVVLGWAALIASRRPDVVTRAQFWAEDGMVFYAHAYNYPGLYNFVAPYGGYLQTFPRIAGVLSLLVGLMHAPLVMNVLGLLVQALPPAFLLSERFAWIVPRLGHRALLALLLVAAPNLNEVHANVTNAQVHLAMLAFLVLLAEPSSRRDWRAFDVVVLLLSGLSGPFCLMLVPVACLTAWRWRDGWSLVRLGCVLGTALLQGAVLLGRRPTARGRPSEFGTGASPMNLLDLLGGQIFIAGLIGVFNYGALYASVLEDHPWVAAPAAIGGLAFVLRAAWVTESFALRVLLLFATLHLWAALSSPIVFGDKSKWELLQMPGAGQRYYYFATIAFLATIVATLVHDPRRAMRAVAAVLLAVLLLAGVRSDFRLPPHRDFDWPEQVRRFEARKPGARVPFEILPPPYATMRLVRRPGPV